MLVKIFKLNYFYDWFSYNNMMKVEKIWPRNIYYLPKLTAKLIMVKNYKVSNLWNFFVTYVTFILSCTLQLILSCHGLKNPLTYKAELSLYNLMYIAYDFGVI